MHLQRNLSKNTGNIKFAQTVFAASFMLIFLIFVNGFAQSGKETVHKPQLRSDGCTVITVGKKATFDGSVMNSHTMDGHKYRTWIDITPAKDHPKGAMKTIYKRVDSDSFAMPVYLDVPIGEIPEVRHTYGFINSAVRCMNDQQLTIGESTFGGRSTLRSDSGMIHMEMLTRILLERCKTARGAIKLAGKLLDKYGWIDTGECLTFADTKEVWHMEIVGPGKGNFGAVWAAQRVPDDQVSVNANASRIRQIDLDNGDYYLASKNVFTVARDSGWWDYENEPFEFCYAYDPEGRESISSRRREWRALSLAAPSLKLHPYDENYPFSVKPDTLVTLEKMIRIFQDYYEHTDYNPVKNITWVNPEGEHEISPLANPFMPYDMNRIFDINGGWGWRGERTIARWYTIYATITQSRDWLPNEVGGLVWLAWDNVAASVYTPIYCSISDLPKSFKTPGRIDGYTDDSAWWAFNRLTTLTAQRWGDMRHDVRNVWDPIQKQLFSDQREIEKQALQLLKEDPKKARAFLTIYSMKWGERIISDAWDLGDFLWTKYDEKF